MPKNEQYNDHHNIARSHGGSNHSCNLIPIDTEEHTQFHRIFEHLTPDQFLRVLTLYGIREGMPHSMSQRLLKKLLEPNIYDPKAIVEFNGPARNPYDAETNHNTLLKANHRVGMCLTQAQKVRDSLKDVLYRKDDTHMSAHRSYLRTQVKDITEGLSRYSSILPEISRGAGEQRVTESSVATHTAYQLLKEANLTTEVIASLLGNGEAHEVTRKRIMAQKHFHASDGVEAVRNALGMRNKQGHYQYVAPLLPSVRHEVFDHAKGRLEDVNAVALNRTIRNLVHHFEALLQKVSKEIQPVILPEQSRQMTFRFSV